MRSHPLPMNVNPGSRVPVYRQIAAQVADAIAARTLVPGEELTPFRELAEMLVISPLAVKKAYEDLMLEGLVRRLDDGRVEVAPEAAEHSRRELAKTLLEEELSLEELQLARNIQCRLLPPSPIEGDGFRVAARNVPARFVAGEARTAEGEPLGYERFADLVAATGHLDGLEPELTLEDLFREVRRAARCGDGDSRAAHPAAFDDDRTALLVESTETRGDA